MAMVNPIIANLQNVKDSRWLTLEVCREFQRSKCTRTDQECKFAHPPPHVEVQNGRVTACFDSIKGKCQRKDPPCKYLHPPQHLREQLLQNGRNNLILKNLQMQAAQAAALSQTQMAVPGLIPVAHPFLGGGAPTSAVAYNPYINASIQAVPVQSGQTCESTNVVSHPTGVIPTAIPTATQGKVRADRLEPQVVEVLTGKKRPRDPAEDLVLQTAMPGMIPYKRVAVADTKSGLPYYQPNAANIATYQQAIATMQMQQQPFAVPVTFAGHPPSVPRF